MATNVREQISIARTLRSRGEFAQAEALLRSLADTHAGFADVHNELGLLCHELGDFDRAQASFARAIEINPAYTEAALHLAITWNDLGRYDEAREIFEEASFHGRSGPRDVAAPVAAKVANMYAEIGDALLESGHPERAVRAYRDALDLAPGFLDIRLRLAQALQDAGLAGEAAAELERVLAEHPHQSAVQIALGVARFAAGRRDEALETWRAVLAADPGNARARSYLRLAGAAP